MFDEVLALLSALRCRPQNVIRYSSLRTGKPVDSDEKPTITDPEEAAWTASQRTRVIDYLTSERCEHGGVSFEPRWFLSPYIAIWAIRSNASSDRIGWWAISGDVPTDYITCTHENDDADVLLSFARVWKSAAAYMANGMWAPNHQIGPPGRQKEFAPMLLSRAQFLEDFANQMKAGSTGE
jgi:Domain of unknown function (DUF4826)